MSEEGEVAIHFDDHGNAVEAMPRAAVSETAQVSSAAADAARVAQESAYWRAVRDNARLENAQLTVASAAKATKAELRQAVETGDVDQLDEAVDRKIDVALHRRMIELHRQQMHQAPPPPADPVERYVAGRPPQTQAWLRQHREYVTDPAKNEKLTRAHFGALADGLTPDTNSYFSAIEKRIGLRDASSKYGKPPDSFIAGKPETHLHGSKVFLTKKEAELATDGTLCWETGPKKGQPLGLDEYGRRKAVLIKRGEYNRLD